VKEVFVIVWGLGLLMEVVAIFYLKPDTPIASFNPKKWKPIWKQRGYFKGPGYAIMIIGFIWIAVGSVGWMACVWLI